MYLILNSVDNGEIIDDFSNDTYTFTMKKNKVHLYNQKMVDSLIKKEFYIEFDELCKKIVDFLNDDTDSEDSSDALYLSDLEKMHDIFLKKYANYISKKEYTKFLNKLRMLTNELKLRSFNKISNIRFKK